MAIVATIAMLMPIAAAIQRGWESRSRGDTYRVAISLPPRTGKSYLTTLAAAWVIGQEPTGSVMRNTADATLYMKMSRLTLNVMRSPRFRNVFAGVELRGGYQAIESWAVNQAKTVSYFGAGVGGRIVGEGCSNAAFTDDLFTNWASAASSHERDRVFDWMLADHDSRIEGAACRFDIGTRWSPDDVIGRLIDADYYNEVICVPAMIDGRSFCEEIISTSALLEKKNLLSQEIWEAEWMQNPIAAGGQLYPPAEMRFMRLSDLDTIPPLYRFCTIDPADKGGDYFAAAFCDVIPWNNSIAVVMRDAVFTRDGIEVACALVRDKMAQWQTEDAFIESNGVGAAACYLLSDVKGTEIKPYTAHEKKDIRILSNYEFIRKIYIFDAEHKHNQHYADFMRHLHSLSKDGKNKNDDSADVLSANGEVVKAKYGRLIYGTI